MRWNLFALVKNKTNILKVIQDYSDFSLKQVGESYTSEEDTCPFCGHHGCFRITESLGLWKCFSEDISGDSIRYVAKVRNIKDWEAALDIAKRYSISLPNDYSPVQEIFNCAAGYYHRNLMDNLNKYPELTNLTPLEYQTTIRKHKKETLVQFSIGWSDGGLIRYLDSLGFQESLVVDSGLMNKKGNGDFLPSKSFIYPHMIRGRVSHFTFKDPLKQKQYQIPNKHKLNGHIFYNSDTIKSTGTIYVVEGENDVLSIAESGHTDISAIATIGMISAGQVDWMTENLSDKQIVTIFDNDSAGDKYREKVEKVKDKFKGLIQIKLSSVKDIDEYLTSGKTLEEALESGVQEQALIESGIEESGMTSEEESSSDGNIIEKEGCYYKIRYKDGQPIHTRISNFVIRLKNIYIEGNNRQREIIVQRQDGRTSRPFIITSEVKVSIKSFKTVVANAIDASFYGQEGDLAILWDFIYKKAEEKEVFLPLVVGRDRDLNGWIFRKCFITGTGAVLTPDADGIIWRNDTGIKPVSLNSVNSNKEEKIDIPELTIDLEPEYKEEFIRTFMTHLATNLGSIGLAITMLGWAKACVYSNEVASKFKFFPFLFFWGKNGKGKTVIGRWLLSIFGMDPSGHSTVGQLGSGVGFQRKAGYYGSLPLIVDEIRADRDTVEHAPMFRSWYTRTGRVLGMKDDFRTRELPVLSCFMFIGEDQFSDNASRERCISIRIPAIGRETDISYAWIEDNLNRAKLSCIGFDWIVESTTVTQEELSEQLDFLDSHLRAKGCNQRISKNWASVGLFGLQIAKKYFPKFDYETYLINTSKSDTVEQSLDDKVMQFFEVIEGMQVASNPKITSDHLKAEGNTLFIWYAELYRLVQAESKSQAVKEEFSKNAIKHAIIEEDYCMDKDAKIALGINQTVRRGILLDLRKAPEVIKNIGRYYLGKNI